jgi:hypothetical protein
VRSQCTPLEFDYFQKSPALSDGAPADWLLSAYPDLYLFGSLVEAEMFGVNDERAPLWKACRDEIFDEIEKLSNKIRGAGADAGDAGNAVMCRDDAVKLLQTVLLF